MATLKMSASPIPPRQARASVTRPLSFSIWCHAFRILIQDRIAELLFGEPEVLVAARQLVNDHTVRVREGGEVTYVHLMFDQHEIVISNGLESESFLPGGQITNLFEQEAVAEIATLFPELDLDTGEGYSPAARRILKRHEAELLAQGAA